MLLGLSIRSAARHIVNTRGTRFLPVSTSITHTKSPTSGLIPGRGSAKSFLSFCLGPLHRWPAFLAPHPCLVSARVPRHIAFLVIVPAGALLGFAEVGMATSARARLDPVWFKQMKSLGLPADPHRAAMRRT